MTDTPEPTEAPTKRMTTAEAARLAQEAASNASAALRVAQGADDQVAAMSEKITDLDQRLRDSPPFGKGPDPELFPTRDQVDGRIHEALAPLHEEVHELRQKGTLTPESKSSLHAVLARLDDAERKIAEASSMELIVSNVAAELHPVIADLRKRMGVIEETRPQDVEGALAKQVLSRIQAVADRQAGFDTHLQQLDEWRRKVGQGLDFLGNFPSSQSLHELVERVAGLEGQTIGVEHGAPAAEQIEHQVDRKLAAMFAEAQLTPARLAGLVRELDGLSEVHNEDHRRVDSVVSEFDGLRARLDDLASYVRSLDSAIGVHPTQASTLVGGLGAPKKVLQLMRMVTHLSKERQADLGSGGKFRFRSIDDAMDAVGHAMREVGLVMSPEVLRDETSTTPVTKKGFGRNGEPYESTILWTTTKLTMRYTFVDPDDGSTHVIEMVGEGRDASDKSTSKAGSMAYKYALLQGLCIPVTGLDDSDAAPPQVVVDERPTPPTDQRQQRQPAPYGSLPGDVTGHERQAAQAVAERTEMEKNQRAADALAAINGLHRLEGGPTAQRARLDLIMQQVAKEGLLEFVVAGSTLNNHGLAALATLAPEKSATYQQPPDSEPGYPPQDGGY